jgi:hypothetical protein
MAEFRTKMLSATAQQIPHQPFKSHHKSFTYAIGNDRNYFFANEKMTGDTG